MRGPKFFLALWLSKGIAHAIDLVAKGRGTNLPGAVALKIDPLFLSHLRGIDPEKTVFITGTNGKSTATNLLNRVLKEAGFSVVSNLDGANMTPGVSVPLLRSCSLLGNLHCDYVVMETDERYVARIRKQLPAKYLCVTNIQKDQVQRNGEPSVIRNKIMEAICPDMTVFLNSDEPNTLGLSQCDAWRVVRYGVAAHEKSFHKDEDFFTVTLPCPKCHSGLTFHHYNLDNVGGFQCPVCGFGNDTAPDYFIEDISFTDKSFRVHDTVYPFHYTLSEFLYNYSMTIAVAQELGVDEDVIARAFSSFERRVGHGESRSVGSHQIKFFRMKQENSETLHSAVNLIAADPEKKTLVFGLDEYIDFYPPYVNGCYLFDCSFRTLDASTVERCICSSPALGYCGALRMMYDGVDPDAIEVIPDSSEQQLKQAFDAGKSENIYLIEEIPYWKR